jgi:gamma-glutamyl-gamma-aminobutyrate hydrolase PuuD
MILQSALFTAPNLWNLFDSVEVVDRPSKLTKDGCLLLHGGEDISPSIYKHNNSSYCHAPSTPSRRDKIEMDFIKQAQELNIPIIGICRGAQLLCAMDGGHLVQHIVGHGHAGHNISSNIYGDLGKSNTAHHQMMCPRKTKSNKLLGYVQETLYGFEQNDKLREYTYCPEIIWFGEFNALAIQGHPEWMSNEDPFMKNLASIALAYIKG